MRQLKSVNGFGSGEGLGCSLFHICFGLPFLFMGIAAFSPVWAAMQSGTGFAYIPVAFLAHAHWVLSSLVCLAFGLMMVSGGAHQT